MERFNVAFIKGDYSYYIPFSSPKDSDYVFCPDGSRSIRKSIVPIIRMTTDDTPNGGIRLLGTLKLSNMIPVPPSELEPYIISEEKDSRYRRMVKKEYSFITANAGLILKNADIIYKQKTNAGEYYSRKPMPGYLKNTVDFSYAEEKCREYEGKT